MGRRSSGWTVVKAIARDIDRANRRSQRIAETNRRAQIRLEEREEREQRKLFESVSKNASATRERFNKAINDANTSDNISTKETKLIAAKQYLDHLKSLQAQHNFIQLGNLSGVEQGIQDIQKDIYSLKAAAEKRAALEKETIDNTDDAQSVREEIENILVHTLNINDAIDWSSLKDNQPFLIREPNKAPKPMMPLQPKLRGISSQPIITDKKYTPQIPIWLFLFPEKKKNLIEAGKALFVRDVQEWEILSKEAQSENAALLVEWEKEKADLLSEWENEYLSMHNEWQRKKDEHFSSQAQYNNGIDKLEQQYLSLDKAATEEYCRLVLSRSLYPFSFSRDYQIEYVVESKLLALDFQLPTIEVVPTLKEEKFIKSKGEVKKTFITEKQQKEIYEKLLYAMIIRTIHELFEADTADGINAIAMNGWVTSLNKATGHDETRCIMTINTTKESFLRINLANIDAKECFKSLKGIGGAKLSDLVPVAPVISLNKEDKRFIESYDVVDSIVDGDNLALMNWEDFEHLIRELFEQEFSSNGGEVKVTQASRDGGVDAVIFDPDPIRGGKIVVQAKRYTNTVGVSAVRDLYGTVQHEGAMKGILITTSNYGSDAYDFAKGKPLTLMNGGNLIHLLERHGRKARINLLEAKKVAQT